MREFVKDGTVEEFELWFAGGRRLPVRLRRRQPRRGEITGAEGETFEAGKLGERTIGPDGVILGPPTRFNADNIDDFDF